MWFFVKKEFSDFWINKIFVLAIFVLHISEISGYLNHPIGQSHQEDNHEYHGPQPRHGPFWDDLRVTWGKNTSYPHFNRLPRTTAEAERHGWYRTSQDCYNDGHFYGFRYAEQGQSSALSLLFDIQGIIAGIQMSVPLNCAKARGNPYQFEQVPMFLPTLINDVEHYTLSAYFVKPPTICTKGRTEEDLREEGTGTGLWFQNGRRRTLGIPLTLDEASYFGWDKVQCFPQMGYHSFYRVDLWNKIRCSRIWPYVLLANKHDQIHGFVFMVFSDCHSKRFEHLPIDAVVKLLNGDSGGCPECAVEQMSHYNMTTMHVYFQDPKTIKC